jgi:hypothetical protein
LSARTPNYSRTSLHPRNLVAVAGEKGEILETIVNRIVKRMSDWKMIRSFKKNIPGINRKEL